MSLRAAKAILVTNIGFTSGAGALAASERIALLVAPVSVTFRTEYSRLLDVEPEGETDMFALFGTILAAVDKAGSGDDVVVQRRLVGTGAGAGGVLGEFLSDPSVRRAAREAMGGPTVRKVVEDVAGSNPDIVRRALDQFRRWPR